MKKNDDTNEPKTLGKMPLHNRTLEEAANNNPVIFSTANRAPKLRPRIAAFKDKDKDPKSPQR